MPVKTSTDFKTLPELAKLLATDGWVIIEYKAIGSNTVSLTLTFQKDEETGGTDG